MSMPAQRSITAVIMTFSSSGEGQRLSEEVVPRARSTSREYLGQDRYRYRAVDSTGQTIGFLLTVKRDALAAQRFLRKALSAVATPQPRVLNVDKNPAHPLAVEKLKNADTLRRHCRLRRCKFLKNGVGQVHRVPKQRVRLAKAYGSFQSAWRTL